MVGVGPMGLLFGRWPIEHRARGYGYYVVSVVVTTSSRLCIKALIGDRKHL